MKQSDVAEIERVKLVQDVQSNFSKQMNYGSDDEWIYLSIKKQLGNCHCGIEYNG